jgi:oligopeptide transport system ATP-binding protein
VKPLLELRELTVDFPAGRGAHLRALDSIDIRLAHGASLGVVGESGSGKSTLGRAVAGLIEPTGGEVRFEGERLAALSVSQRRSWRRRVQMVFQDPHSSFDPRMTIAASVAEPLASFEPSLNRPAIDARVSAMLARVGLAETIARRFPHELSGGQCQRAAIARALIAAPDLVVCDEALSSLDVSVQAQIVRLLDALRSELGVSLLVISHNLAIVRLLSDVVVVLYLGRIMEIATRDQLFETARHPYTMMLLASIPTVDPDRERARRTAPVTEAPSRLSPPTGCVFRTRCPIAIARCSEQRPELEIAGSDADHRVACHRWQEASAEVKRFLSSG